MVHDVGARLVDGAPVVVHQAGGSRRERLGGGDGLRGVGVAGRRGDGLHRRPGLVEDLAAVGGEGLRGLVEDVLPAQDVLEHALAGAALAGRGRRELVTQVIAEAGERDLRRGGGLVDRSLVTDGGREPSRRRSDEVEEPLGVVDPALHGSGGESGLERVARLGEQRWDAGQPARQRLDALGGRPELAHEQREHAGHDLEDGAGMALRHPAQLERAQTAADHLKGGERVDRGAGVVRRQKRREAPLVLVQQLAAPLESRGRPRRQAAGALRHAERRAEHGVVGDQIVQQRPDGRLHLATLLHGHADPPFRRSPSRAGRRPARRPDSTHVARGTANAPPRVYAREVAGAEGGPASDEGVHDGGPHPTPRPRPTLAARARRDPVLRRDLGDHDRGRRQFIAVTRRGEGRPARRQHPGRRQPQPVHRVLGAGLRGLPPQLRHAHRLQAQRRRRAGDRRQLDEHAGLPHVDVQDPPRHQVAGRRARSPPRTSPSRTTTSSRTSSRPSRPTPST